MQVDGDKFYKAEECIENVIKAYKKVNSVIETINGIDMSEYPYSSDLLVVCEDIKTVETNLNKLSEAVVTARLNIMRVNDQFSLNYSKAGSESNFLSLTDVFDSDVNVSEMTELELEEYLKSLIEEDPDLKYIVEKQNLIEYINTFENGRVAEYLFGNGEYSEYVSRFITEDKKYFICYNDGLGKDDKNFGFGILHYYKGKYQEEVSELYKKYGIDITNGEYNDVGISLVPVDVVLKVQEGELEKKRELVINQIGEENFNKLSVPQQHCLIDIAYQGCSSWNSLKKLLDEGKSNQEIVKEWPRLTSTKYNNQDRANARKELWLNDNYTDGLGNDLN